MPNWNAALFYICLYVAERVVAPAISGTGSAFGKPCLRLATTQFAVVCVRPACHFFLQRPWSNNLRSSRAACARTKRGTWIIMLDKCKRVPPGAKYRNRRGSLFVSRLLKHPPLWLCGVKTTWLRGFFVIWERNAETGNLGIVSGCETNNCEFWKPSDRMSFVVAWAKGVAPSRCLGLRLRAGISVEVATSRCEKTADNQTINVTLSHENDSKVRVVTAANVRCCGILASSEELLCKNHWKNTFIWWKYGYNKVSEFSEYCKLFTKQSPFKRCFLSFYCTISRKTDFSVCSPKFCKLNEIFSDSS